MIVSIIAAIGKNSVIGSKNKLPWRLPSDLKRFKFLTSGHPIIIGRKTFESIGKVLPGRKNIVVTRNSVLSPDPNLVTASSIEEGLKIALESGAKEAFIIGGDSIFREAIHIANKLYITYVDVEGDGDTFFPTINTADWQEVNREPGMKTDEDEYSFEYVNYERKS